MRPLLLASALTLAAQIVGQDVALHAAVLEHPDRWTDGATGTARLLKSAGFGVEPLTVEALKRADLVVFGTFTNNNEPYRRFLAAHTDVLREFVHRGGVVLELAQSDQFGARATYLPNGCDVRRGDRDENTVHALIAGHPLVAWLATERPTKVTMLNDEQTSWETLETWTGGQVVIAAGDRDQYAALVEVEHGNGRFLVASLWLDKLERGGQTVAPKTHLQAANAFAKALQHYVVQVKSGKAPAVVPAPPPPVFPVGPMVGHVDATTAHVWMRPRTTGTFILHVDAADDSRRIEAEALEDGDRCVTWRVERLRPNQEYRYRITSQDGEPVAGGRDHRFVTASPPGTAASTTLAFGSCAKTAPSSIWSAMGLRNIDGLVLLGDTPYIDTTDLRIAREKHRAFLEIPELAGLIRNTPTWGTWDDHDFGKNDSDGNLPGKEHTRHAFVDYRALASYGQREQGIYTSFRRGPIEVFLLDARWFARTETVSADDSRPSLLGKAQWTWLEKRLIDSTAPFKVVATGMIWDDKENRESDDWGSYPHERDRLERFLGERSISGVVLVGGDIHVSRHLSYSDTKARAGYVLDQLIVSPLHTGVIPSLDVPHPALLWSAREPRVFMTLTASTLDSEPTLTARWIQDIGRGAGRVLREVSWRAAQLQAQ